MSEQTKVLVIEDDYKLGLAISLRLKHLGYEVVQAHDGRSAVERAKEFKPDLVLMDICLPVMDGFSVAERLYGAVDICEVPIVFITASKKAGLRERAEELGGAGFLEKPFDQATIQKTIESALANSGRIKFYKNLLEVR